MTIDRIGYTDPIQSGKKAGRNESINQNSKSDSINLSSEAIEKSELYRAIEVVSTAPDVRADLVAEMKAKINDPSYINDRILQAAADKIIESFGL
ncbi:MAG: flagellar biosynthesis anti-sigma factor FlgM [Treponema sp.]|jgi:negative regulator of flagellin synthesis FlgM|nr:flagellar biosynthesis anti-sigma factor FlgM [Treponema sp.]